MCKLKSLLQKQQLTIMFAAIIFLFMFFAMLLVFLGAFVLYRLDIIGRDRPAGTVLFLFALISLLVGIALSILFSRFPLAPLRELMEAADRIAHGDYTARINLKAPAELKRLSEKFNHMAEEISSVKFAKLDVDTNGRLAQQYGVMNIPTLLVFKDGKVAGSAVGLQSKESLRELLGV